MDSRQRGSAIPKDQRAENPGCPFEPRIHELQHRELLLADEVRQLRLLSAELVTDWRSQPGLSRLGFYMARVGGESLTLLRWRRSGRTPGPGGRRFELLHSAEWQALLPALRNTVASFERRRQAINFAHSVRSYELSRIREYLSLRRGLG